MKKYVIEEVNSPKLKKHFLQVPHLVYQGDANWVCTLDAEISAIFDPKKNNFYHHGEAQLFLLKDQEGKYVGRIAAFINHKKANNFEVPTGGIGFFESIEDQEAAFLLFDAAQKWLAERGMEAMDGPINFGENDRHWGLLVHGFSQPAYGMQYHKPYYQTFFENYGFTMFFEQVSNELNIEEPLPERFVKIAKWIAQKDGIEFKYIHKENLQEFVDVFQEVYNDAWQFHENFTPITEQQMQDFQDEFRDLAIDVFLPVAYVKGEAAAFILCLPDINQIFKPLKGKFNIIQKLLFKWRSRNQFEWYRKRGILTHGRVVIMGVKPKFQRYGLESGLIVKSVEDAREMGFKSIELSWVGDFNPKMRRLHEATGAKLVRKHYTYRHFFDPNYEGNRSEIIPMNTKDQLVQEKEQES